MSDMIGRVAKAIQSAIHDSAFCLVDSGGDNPGEKVTRQFCEVLAMDAIEAMREIDSDMIYAANIMPN